MEFCQVLGFLKILSESIKIFLKNVKVMASIITLCLLLSSILFLLFVFSFQSAITYMDNFSVSSIPAISIMQLIIVGFVLPVSIELTFLCSYISISHVSGMATVLATATSDSDIELSLQDLFLGVKATWRSPFRNYYRRSGNLMQFLCAMAVVTTLPVVICNPSPIAIAIVSAVVVSVFGFQLYASVVLALSAVIAVVEEYGQEWEAVEKAEKLVEGQKLHGFMVNLFFNIVGLIVLLSFWMILGDQGSLNITVYGLFFVNCVSVTRIFMSVAYTVYYFRCSEYHGQQIQLFWNSHYTTLLN